MSGSDYHEFSLGHFAEKIHDEFSGEVYENEHTATGDPAFRFETVATKLRNVVIFVSTFDALLGTVSSQRYPIPVGTTLTIRDVDLSLLWFKNMTIGNDTKINIIGTVI